MTMILNLTQHSATPDQKKAGVIDLSKENRDVLLPLLNFPSVEATCAIEARAEKLANLVDGASFNTPKPAVMIGGAPYLMGPLEVALARRRYKVVYAFSVRSSVEVEQSDGTVVKRTVFEHAGFVNGALG